MSSALQKHSAAAAYAGVMLVLGLPVWWKTTEVYRAPLPYSEISSLAGVDTRQRAEVFLLCLEEEEAHLRAPILQKLLTRSTVFDIHLNVKPPYPSERRIMEDSSSLEEVDALLGPQLLRDSPGSVALVEAPSSLFTTVPHLVLGNHRLVYYSTYTPTEELAALLVDRVLGEPSLSAALRSLPLTATPSRSPGDRGESKRSSGEMDVFLSLLVPQPEHVAASWQIEAATETYLRPFLDSFPINFTVKSQVLYLTPLDIPAAQQGSGPLQLTPEQLGLAVNSVETLLASQASAAPALNLLVYLPPLERAPLTLQGSETDSFLIPRWGGVLLYNYLGEEQVKFPLHLDLDMARITGVWIGQLRHLLGVQEVSGDMTALPLPPSGLRVWERDFQLRLLSLQYCLHTVSTLSSLSHLLSQIPNIVISEEVGSKVASAVGQVKRGAHLVGQGRLLEGFTAAQEALQLAEAAFFDKSLLALLYFPDDQKYAIYIPFFLPVGIPVLLSLKTLLKFFRGELKPKVD